MSGIKINGEIVMSNQEDKSFDSDDLFLELTDSDILTETDFNIDENSFYSDDSLRYI